ncbi:MAG: hypothetical protein ACRDJC_24450 [Thermomicrobiales bacterium]
MLSRTHWARAAALTASIAIVSAALPSASVVAQEAPVVALEQARSGEDGTSGAGATSGNLSSGNAERDRNGNGGNASAGSAGEAGTAENTEASDADLPENAELLDALGVLDDVTMAGVTVLTGLDIPVELLPPPVEEPVSAAPTDINTGGQGGSGETSSISTEPGTGTAPAGGSISSAAEDGVGATTNDEKTRDRPRKNADGGTDTATTSTEDNAGTATTG